jgi:hypothetical protein
MAITWPVFPHIDAPQPAVAPAASPRPSVAGVPPRVVNRVTLPDLTGFYEHVPVKGKDSAILLQFCQAGQVLVGWFTGPPSFVTNLSPTVSRTGGSNETRMRPGVLVAFLSDMHPATQTVQFSWRQTPEAIHSDLADPLAMYALDPTDGVGEKIGKLRFDDPLSGIGIGSQIALAFEFNSNFRPTEPSGYDRFIRVSMATRLSNFMINSLPTEMQLRLLVEQVCPVPSSYIDNARAQLASSAGQEPHIASMIADWWRKSERSLSRKIARERIGNEVSGILNPGSTDDY